jgi:RimJ/RimL family protein N-acetyltransferase
MTEPMIETARLVLRPPAMADFERWCELMADPEAARHVGGVQPAAMVWRSMMGMAGAWALTGVSMFSVIERDSGRWVGRIGPWQPHGWPGTEIGWSLHRDAWGRGYATEAAAACMDYAFDVLGWDEVIHCIAPDNLPSQRVAQRLGARLRGPARMPAPYQDVAVEIWGQTRDEWRTRGA